MDQNTAHLETNSTTAARAASPGYVVVPGGWSGWAVQYPDRLPKLFGALEIATLNDWPEEGTRLVHLAEVTAAPKAIPLDSYPAGLESVVSPKVSKPKAREPHEVALDAARERMYANVYCAPSLSAGPYDLPQADPAPPAGDLPTLPTLDGFRGLHPETLGLVRRFAYALACKLSASETKYGYSDGWMRGDWMDECRAKLAEHAAKGDPRDVAAYCAFLWHHGESTAPQADPAPPASGDGGRVLTCVYCGQEYPQGTAAWGESVLTEHIGVCQKHPMRGVGADNTRLRAALVGIVGASDPGALREMATLIATLPGEDADKAATINAINALLGAQ